MIAPFSALAARLRALPQSDDSRGTSQTRGTILEAPPRRTALERRPVEALAALGFLWAVVLIALAAHCSTPLQGARGVPSDLTGSRRSPLPPAVGSRDSAVLLPLLADLDAIDLRLHRLAERGGLYAQATAAASSPAGCVLGVADYVYRPSEVLATCRTTPRIGR